MNKKYSLSVTIITKNEADRITNCLASVKDLADEIIVYDSGSTDGTRGLPGGGSWAAHTVGPGRCVGTDHRVV